MRFLFLSITLLALFSCSHNQGIAPESSPATKQELAGKSKASEGMKFFKGSFEEALAEARKTNKILFVDVYTEWCGPCKMMTAYVFPQSEVGGVYNKYFINYKLDAEDESINGPEIADKYEVGGFPTFLFFDGEGNLLDKQSGGMDTQPFIIMGQNASGADISVFCQDFENGDRSLGAFLTCYATKENEFNKAYDKADGNMNDPVAKKADQKFKKFYNDYFDSWSEEQLLTDDGLKLIGLGPIYLRGERQIEFAVEHIEEYLEIADEPEMLAGRLTYANNSAIAIGYKEGRDPDQYLADIKGKLAPAYMAARPDADLERDYQRARLDLVAAKHAKNKNWQGFYQARIERIEYSVAAAGGGDARRERTIKREKLGLLNDLLNRGCDDKKVLREAVIVPGEIYSQDKNIFAGIMYMRALKVLGEKQKGDQVYAEIKKEYDEMPDRIKNTVGKAMEEYKAGS